MMPKEPYSKEEIVNGVGQIAGFHGWNSGVNAVVLNGEKHAIIVETLYQPQDARRLFKRGNLNSLRIRQKRSARPWH
jgi:hypothetical protein